ncbi:YggS family pyridoxal phosphate-dependent enzyme [Alteribacillus sp. YIM 98480]|uniref:YggS family pyridoxal phosphate-dependent enzyme n=1 Tax=Alteribacillus sp. YIM 98480 TaxID=2606599 RepID=UPI0018EF2348|nr:YggS family pyridoxal phosphate-dependent enzyme [Alteribacillus sp. YIM 98480]
MTVTNNLVQIQQTIKEACSRSDRHTDKVTIIAVTKYVTLDKTKEAIEAGIHHIGENRLEGALEKWEAFHGQAEFHFIGSLQSKKAKHLVDKYDYIHSLDRLSLAKELQKRCPDDKKLQCFVQVNTSGETSKSGLAPEETLDFIKKLEDYPSLKVIGLMTMAPYEEDPEHTRPVFRRLRELRDEIHELHLEHAPCEELSMGMSNDFHIAIEEGATFIRLGSTLVGHE